MFYQLEPQKMEYFCGFHNFWHNLRKPCKYGVPKKAKLRPDKSNRKYKSRETEYNGIRYHSGLEANDARWLDTLLKQGKIKKIERQHRIDLKVKGKHIAYHIVDFLITLNDGRKKYVETKGFPTDMWVRNRKHCQAQYPKIEYLTNPKEKELLN